MPSVSIVLPVHNGARYLRDSLDSCLAQSYSDLELVVVDDGSVDETPEILRGYADPRMRVYTHARNRGLPASLNAGFARTTGEYLTWTSDDNSYMPDAIETMVSYLRDHPDVDFVYSRCLLVDENGQVTGERQSGPPGDLRYYNCVGGSFMYRRRVYETIGEYNDKVFLSEDYEYWVRTSLRFRMAFIDRPLYYYREHSHSLTATNYGAYRAQRLSLKTRRRYFSLAWKSYASQMARWFVTEAFDSYKRNDLSNARAAALHGLAYDPGWIRNRGLLSIVLEGLAGKRLARAARHLIQLLAEGWGSVRGGRGPQGG